MFEVPLSPAQARALRLRNSPSRLQISKAGLIKGTKLRGRFTLSFAIHDDLSAMRFPFESAGRSWEGLIKDP